MNPGTTATVSSITLRLPMTEVNPHGGPYRSPELLVALLETLPKVSEDNELILFCF